MAAMKPLLPVVTKPLPTKYLEMLYEAVVTVMAVNGQDVSLKTLRRRQLSCMLDLVGGNKRDAAKVLGISRSTLYAILHETEHRPINRHSGSRRLAA